MLFVTDRAETRRPLDLGMFTEERRWLQKKDGEGWGEASKIKKHFISLIWNSNALFNASCGYLHGILFRGRRRGTLQWIWTQGLVVRSTFIRSSLVVVICHLSAFGQWDFTLHFDLNFLRLHYHRQRNRDHEGRLSFRLRMASPLVWLNLFHFKNSQRRSYPIDPFGSTSFLRSVNFWRSAEKRNTGASCRRARSWTTEAVSDRAPVVQRVDNMII